MLHWLLAPRLWQREVIFSSRALSFAPVIVGGLLYAINPQTVDLLLYDPTGNKLLAYAVSLGAYRHSCDTLDDQKGDSTMTSGLGLVAFAIAAATATLVLIIHELHIRALNTRVSKAVMGVPGQSAPFQDMTGWFSSLGMRYRRFYSRGKSGTTTNDPSIVRFQSSSNLADLDRCQNCQHVLIPDRCLVVLAQLLGKPLTDLLIFTAHWRGDRNYGATIDPVDAQSGVSMPPFG